MDLSSGFRTAECVGAWDGCEARTALFAPLPAYGSERGTSSAARTGQILFLTERPYLPRYASLTVHVDRGRRRSAPAVIRKPVSFRRCGSREALRILRSIHPETLRQHGYPSELESNLTLAEQQPWWCLTSCPSTLCFLDKTSSALSPEQVRWVLHCSRIEPSVT
jgi:hypothetical protein